MPNVEDYNAEHAARALVGEGVKRLACAFVLAACGGGGGRAPEVSLVLPAPSASATVAKTLLECTIVGTGERRREGEDADAFPFRVFDGEESREPVFVIARPEIAHVTWWHFPRRAGRGRARVGLGDQAHVRYEGWADLWGRTFTTTTRMDAVAGHLWARQGSPIDLMSANGGEIFGSVPTQFRAPKTIVVQGNCADVVYEPATPPRESKPRHITVVNEGPAIHMFASPTAARAFTMVTPQWPVYFDVVERSGDFVHVTGEEGNIGFDAYVPASETREYAGGRLGGHHMTRRPTIGVGGPTIRVPRDTPLYVSTMGEGPLAVAGAVIERGAVIAYDLMQATKIDGREIVPFDFTDRFIVAPEGGHLWIAKDVVTSAP